MRRISLGEVCTVVMGQAPNGSTYNFEEDGWPLLAGAGDFGAVTPIATKYTSEPTKLSAIGDIILCIRATIGDLNWSDKIYCLGRGVAGLRPKQGKLHSGYLWHWMAANKLELAKRGKGSTFKQVSRDDIQTLEITLPETFDEQRRIAAILDKSDAIRRKRQQTLAASESLEHSLFLQSVGPKAEDYQGWALATFEELAKSGKGSMRTGPFGSDLRHSEFVDEGIAVLGIDNAVKNRFAWGERRFITPEKYEKLKRYRVSPGDVIVTIMGTTGRSAVVPDDIPLAITTKHLATITPDRSKAEAEFLSNALHRHPAVLAQIAKANKGAIMDGLNLGIIKSLQIPLPPIGVQRRYVIDLHRLRAMQAKMREQLVEADILFASLSQRAFRGEL